MTPTTCPKTRIHWSLVGAVHLSDMETVETEHQLRHSTPSWFSGRCSSNIALFWRTGNWGIEHVFKPIAVIAVSIYHNAMKLGKTYAWVLFSQVKQSREDLLRPDGWNITFRGLKCCYDVSRETLSKPWCFGGMDMQWSEKPVEVWWQERHFWGCSTSIWGVLSTPYVYQM